MSYVAAAVGVGSLAYGIYNSESQKSKANKINESNPRPNYVIPDEFRQNQAMAQQMARIGLPQQQYDNQQNAISRNQAGGLTQLGLSANPGAGVASIVRAGNDANNSLNAQDAAARMNNQRFAIQQNGVMGQQELAQQQSDKFDKYTENFNRAQALEGAANQNLNNSVNSAATLAGGLASSGAFNKSTVKNDGNQGDAHIDTVLPGATTVKGYDNPALANPNNKPIGTNWNTTQFGYQPPADPFRRTRAPYPYIL
jgi:hypothetical protein